jgi:hypothetical protein
MYWRRKYYYLILCGCRDLVPVGYLSSDSTVVMLGVSPDYHKDNFNNCAPPSINAMLYPHFLYMEQLCTYTDIEY